MRNWTKVVWLVAMVALLAVVWGCQTRSDQSPSGSINAAESEEESGMDLLGSDDWEPLRTVEGEPLSEEETAALLGRLPAMEMREGDEVAFRRRAESLPVPLTGETVEGAWPPDLSSPTAGAGAEGPIKVQAFRPEGEVRGENFQVALAFDRPVVAVGAVDTQSMPEVSVEPAIEGRWRWLGTRTLVFEPAGRWPQSTEFEVRLAAGFEGIDGSALEEAVAFRFSTPTVEVMQIVPAGASRGTDQPVAVVFNQPVAEGAQEAIKVEANGRMVAMRRLEGDAARDAAESLGVQGAWEEERVVVMAPVEEFAGASRVTIRVSGMVSSKEGPLLGEVSRQGSFQVRGPFQLVRVQCGWGAECRPGQPFQLDFTNGIEMEAEAIDVRLTPEVANLKVEKYGTALTLTGDFQAYTDYEIEVRGEVEDVFGQSLQGNRSGKVSVEGYPQLLVGPNQSVVVRPTTMAATLPLRVAETEQFRARVYDVDASDWERFVAYQRGETDSFGVSMAAEEVFRFSRSERRELRDVEVDLSAALDDGLGHAVVVIDDVRPEEGRYRYYNRQVYWVQRTDLSVDLTTDGQNFAIRVTSLEDGSALQGAEVRHGRARHTTDARGEVDFAVQPIGEQLLVRHEGHELLIPANGQTNWFHRGMNWPRRVQTQTPLWFVVNDRGMYKPGETVTVQGWVRYQVNTPEGQTMRPKSGQELRYTVTDPRGANLEEGTVRLDRDGGFGLEVAIPEGANLGHASVQFQGELEEVGRLWGSHSFQIQEFRRPEFEVGLVAEGAPFMPGEALRMEGTAEYYAGGALPGAEASMRFVEQQGSYQPPGWSGWSFGKWSPWWWGGIGGYHGRGVPGVHGGGGEPQVLPMDFRSGISGQTDASGTFVAAGLLESTDEGLPRSIEATFSVTDVNRQSWSATQSVLVHPAAVYLGIKSEKNFIQRHESYVLEMVAVDLDGRVVEGAEVAVRLMERRGWQDDGDEVARCEKTSGEEPVTCEFSSLSPGSYRVNAQVTDEAGRVAKSELTFWVAGQDRRGAETSEEGQITLIPDQEEYGAGDTATLMVQAPYYPVDAIVEVRRSGRLRREIVRIEADNPVVVIAIDEAMIPNVHVSVIAQRAGDEYAMDAFASGELNLPIDRGAYALAIDLEPSSEAIEPGARLGVVARVKDQAGQPVEGAQVLLYAVDEAVLALSGYQLGNPLETFLPQRPSDTTQVRSRSWLLLDADEEDLPTDANELADGLAPEGSGGRGMAVGRRARAESMAMEAESMAFSYELDMEGLGGGAKGGAEPINLREVFDAMAFFEAELRTDAEGRVQIEAEMPESLTRYRLMAVAIEGDRRAGTAETNVTARLPLMIRPSEPRFVNVGDQFDFSVVVQNQTASTRTVDLAIRSTENLRWHHAPGRRVEVPGGDRIEVFWRGESLSAGEARVQVAGASGTFADAAMVDFPILTPATTEAFATYGSIGPEDDDALLEALQVPKNAYAQYGGLDVQASSTQLQALTDALIYLTTYRFYCSEQLASRILSVVALYDVLEAFEAPELPAADELRGGLQAWVDRLIRHQRSDGGFGFWEGSTRTDPFVTVHTVLALYRANQEGIEVPEQAYQRALNVVANIDRYHFDYGDRTKATIEAYALNVRHAVGHSVAAREVDDLMGKYGIETLSMEALGWLLPLVVQTPWESRVMERITGQVQETAATAEFQESYPGSAHMILHTTRRTDGVVLDGLLQVDPQHYLVEKVVRGLMAHRTRGHWLNTQENVFILMALRRYFDVYEADRPDFVARAWLGEEQILEHEFEGRTTDRAEVSVPMSYLAEGADEEPVQPVVLQRDGEGRMYYRMGVRYAPKDRELPPMNNGFDVERVYLPVDNDDDVRRGEDGAWEIRAGARVQVQLTMSVAARRYHVALVDWLPAGFEVINTNLAVSSVEAGLTGGTSSQRSWYWWWGGPWFEHENLRDERVEAFASLISNGVYTYTYVARATMPGEYIAMPTKAEEMYHPETFGRSSTEVVRVLREF